MIYQYADKPTGILVVRPRLTTAPLIAALLKGFLEAVDLNEPRFRDALVVLGPAGFRIHQRQ